MKQENTHLNIHCEIHFAFDTKSELNRHSTCTKITRIKQGTLTTRNARKQWIHKTANTKLWVLDTKNVHLTITVLHIINCHLSTLNHPSSSAIHSLPTTLHWDEWVHNEYNEPILGSSHHKQHSWTFRFTSMSFLILRPNKLHSTSQKQHSTTDSRGKDDEPWRPDVLFNVNDVCNDNLSTSVKTKYSQLVID